YEISDVIGDRAFHRDANIVAELASAYIEGMRDAGMASTGKHFPGHGAIKEDSHLAIPIDSRSKEDIFSADIQPFIHLFKEGLDAVMPAHVIYPEIDNNPAGFSRVWLQDILRQQLKFDGVIFSDDLTMEGASVAGGFTERAEAAIEAGCDMILACNHRQGAIEILDNVQHQVDARTAHRLKRMQGDAIYNRSSLLVSDLWKEAVECVTMLS
ncbi:MAG: beta-N-acetylhexosaminidase, partial [Thiotrichaceae bacterium]